jgi:hypothetical protein
MKVAHSLPCGQADSNHAWAACPLIGMREPVYQTLPEFGWQGSAHQAGLVYTDNAEAGGGYFSGGRSKDPFFVMRMINGLQGFLDRWPLSIQTGAADL